INKRSYADKLDKFEPGDLNDSLCPSQNQFKMIDNGEIEKLIDTAKIDQELAIQMSNHLIERIINGQQNAVAVRCSAALHSGS
ncbi:unnamed protein product, partial [marine sediment metagenome]